MAIFIGFVLREREREIEREKSIVSFCFWIRVYGNEVMEGRYDGCYLMIKIICEKNNCNCFDCIIC